MNLCSCCSPSIIGIILWITCLITSPNDYSMSSGGLWIVYRFYNGAASLLINSLVLIFGSFNIINPLTLLFIGLCPSFFLFLGLQIKRLYLLR
jgi:hypothetical protein